MWRHRHLSALPGGGLAAKAQALDQRLVALQVVPPQVVEESAAAAHDLEQAAARMVVLRVMLEVLRKLVDPVGEQGDLHLRRARIGLMAAMGLDDRALRLD